MKSRLKWSIRLAAAITAFVVSVAAAFFFAAYIADGVGEGTTGEGTTTNLTATVTVPNGLTPSNPVPLAVNVQNTTGSQIQFSKVQLTISTPGFPTCGQQWLEIKPTSGFMGFWEETFAGTNAEKVKVATGTHNIFTEGGWPTTEVQLRFKPGLIASTDQTACEKQAVKVSAHLE